MDETSKATDDCVLLKKPFCPPKKITLTEEELKGFGKQVRSRPNPCPYIRIYDANTQTEQDILNCNPSKPAVEIGLSFSF